jgi:hypothetical protein
VWINNGLVTWLPTLYKQMFQLPLQTSLAYGWITSGVASNMSLLRLRLSRHRRACHAAVRNRDEG